MIDRYHDISCNAANCFPHKHTPSLSLHSEIHYSRDTSCPDACSASPSSATRIYGHVQLSCSPYTLPDWAVRCLFIHQNVLSGSFFLHHCHLPKRHFVDLHLSMFALEQEDTWVERPEEEYFFGLQLSSSVPLSFPLSSSSLIILPLLQSKHPNQNLSFSFSHPHPHPFNPNPISVSKFKIQFTNLHIPNPAQTTLVPTTATFLGNTPNLDPERIIVPDCSRSCFIPE